MVIASRKDRDQMSEIRDQKKDKDIENKAGIRTNLGIKGLN